jgi:outer membrane receptor protein involved in Fe transport
MKLLYGGAYNAPSLDETLINHPGLKGNPNLVPEKVGTLDAQVSYRSESYSGSVDYFYSRQTDLIIQDGAVPTRPFTTTIRIPVNFQGGEGKANTI